MGVDGLDFLEGNFAVQLHILGDKDFTQAALGVRPQDAITHAGKMAEFRGRRVRVDGRVRRRRLTAHHGQARLHVGIGELA